ncbi:MAG: type IV pilus twitching motility protein PilT [Kofleriaceae bacterium]|nr:type IV pilus twitching motility protein PilT [Myxococcales bacterium]MCB9564547.1 type IV pilus twitching motility protein PilT [Kofleriaceae bacterium]
MARLDYFFRTLERFGAQAVVLQSNQNVVLRFPTGDRHASQQITHQVLVQLLKESAPPDVMGKLERGDAARFEVNDPGGRFAITAEIQGGGLMVTIEQVTKVGAGGGPPAATPVAVPGRPAVGVPVVTQSPSSAPTATQVAGDAGEMLIERTAYEAVDEVGSSSFLDTLLRTMKQMGASDLHLTCGSPPMVRLHGEIQPLPDRGPLDAEQLLRELLAIAPSDNRVEFDERNDTDFGYALPGVSRFRANFFRDRMGPGAVFRTIPFEMPEAAKLGIPSQVLQLCDLTKGLVLVTGPTGSGKSTTLASLIDHINQHRNAHIITIEDPIEFVHQSKRCLVNQREIRTHTRSFKDALRAALREDPDIVLVGEMRDLETISIAIETAETGHLVFGTLHTTTAPGTVDRIIDQFPPDRQEQIRMMLSESLQGVISQVLCKKIGGGRAAAYEILLGSNAVSNLIREKKTFQLFSVMQTSRNQGMVTMNDSLLDLVRRKVIEPREAYLKAVNKAEIKGLLQKMGAEI